ASRYFLPAMVSGTSFFVSSCLLAPPPPPTSTLFPYTTLFRSLFVLLLFQHDRHIALLDLDLVHVGRAEASEFLIAQGGGGDEERSEEHTSELQSPCNLVCRLLLEKKKNNPTHIILD